MQYSRRDEQRALEVIGNLRKAMQDLGHSKTKLFGKIVAYQNSLLLLESSEMDESALGQYFKQPYFLYVHVNALALNELAMGHGGH